jgi:hypothetical protein
MVVRHNDREAEINSKEWYATRIATGSCVFKVLVDNR